MMEKIMEIVLPGSIRSKKNSKRAIMIGKGSTRRLTVIPSKAYLDWEKEVRKTVLLQLPNGWSPIKYPRPIAVKATAYYKGPQPDLSGVLESVGDCLEGVIWENDRQILSWDGSRLYHDKENPRTLIEVEEM